MIDTNTAIAILGAASLFASIVNMMVTAKIFNLAQQALTETRNASNQAGGALVLARDMMQRDKQ